MLRDLSSGERSFVVSGCDLGVRYDGRGFDDYRSITIENEVFPHLNGSSRVKIAQSVDIICSVKVEVLEINGSCDLADCIEVGVEFSPSCRLGLDDKAILLYQGQVGHNLMSVLVDSESLSLEDLCIISNKFYWKVYVDLMILQSDGDPLEICSIATFIALSSCKIPKVELSTGDSGVIEDFDVIGDISQSLRLKHDKIPICIVLSKINSNLIIDSNVYEQACASCILAIAIDMNGQHCGIKYLKSGSLSMDELLIAINKAEEAGKEIFKQIERYFENTEKIGEGIAYPDLPAVRLGLLV